MTQELKPDICVIGAGAAGRATASAAAAFGVPVVLIEKGTLGHGGGMPAAALAVTAERANIIRNAAHFGLRAARFGVDFAAVKAHVRDVAGTVAPSEARQRLAGLGVRIIDGAARLRETAFQRRRRIDGVVTWPRLVPVVILALREIQLGLT